MEGIRSLDERQVQRYCGYRDRILAAAERQSPGSPVNIQADEYVVTEPITIEQEGAPFQKLDPAVSEQSAAPD